VLQDVLKEKEEELAEKVSQIESAQVAKDVANRLVETKRLQLDAWGNSHSITMMRLNDPTARLPYYAIRCKRSAMMKAIKLRRTKHPNSILIYQNQNVPNPINLYNRLKASGILHFKRNYCTTRLTEADLIGKLGELYEVIQ
jgi:hypothetical protein